MAGRRRATLVLALLAAPAPAQQPAPAPSPELLEFLGEWRPGEEVLLDDGADAVPVPVPGSGRRE